MSATPGNSLYLYRLLSEKIGVGRQTMLARVEDVLLEDDIMASDLGCASVRELLESLDFVRVAVFKRGRVYATILPQPEWDALLERLGTDDGAEKGEQAAPHKSWKRKRGAKTVRPEKPRPRGRVKQESSEVAPAVEEAPAVEVAPVVEVVPAALEAVTVENLPADAVVPSDDEGINLTITYIPAGDDLTPDVPPEPDESQPEAVSNEQLPAPPNPLPRRIRRPMPPMPQSFAAEVWCPNEILELLYRLLPFDISPLTLLDEDWTAARSTEAYALSTGGVSFDLHCLRGSGPEDEPVRATLGRRPPSASGKRWQLISLEGPLDEALVSFEGLPAAREGAWAELDGLPTGAYRPTSPERLFARFAACIASTKWPRAQTASPARSTRGFSRRESSASSLASTRSRQVHRRAASLETVRLGSSRASRQIRRSTRYPSPPHTSTHGRTCASPPPMRSDRARRCNVPMGMRLTSPSSSPSAGRAATIGLPLPPTIPRRTRRACCCPSHSNNQASSIAPWCWRAWERVATKRAPLSRSHTHAPVPA